MRRVKVFVALLIGISGAFAGDPLLEGLREYVDPLTGYTVVREQKEPRTYYEILEEDSDDLVSSFTIEKISDKVLLKDFSVPETSKDENGFQSLVTILGYLESEGYEISGSESDFFLSDSIENRSFYTGNGFALLSEIPDFLMGMVAPDDTIYMRKEKTAFEATDDHGFEGYIER